MVAHVQCDFFSEILGLQSSMTVLLPEPHRMARASRPRDFSLLLLLHGLSDDHTAWTRQTALERYVDGTNLAVVMPAVGRSFYTDMAEGPNYFTYFSEELLDAARSFFPITADRDRCFVAGLSMGGYGAMKLALRHPDRFAKAASFSGVLDIAAYRPEEPWRKAEMARIFGSSDEFPPLEELLWLASEAHRAGAELPKLLVTCGTDDGLLAQNRRFGEHATKLGLDLTYEENSGEGHTWSYWDQMIERTIRWMVDRAPS